MAEATKQESKPRAEEPKPVPPPGKPSVCKPDDRAPAGWTRYKVFGTTGLGNQPTRYVLAKSEAEAKACYLEAVPKEIQGLEVVVRKLAD